MACVAFGATTLLLFGFIYWQTAGLETGRTDHFLVHEAEAIAREPPEAMLADVDARYAPELHRNSFAAIFSRASERLAGDLTAYPRGLPADGQPHEAAVTRQPNEHEDAIRGDVVQSMRAVAMPVAGDRVLVVGHSDQELSKLRELMLRAMALGLLPALVSALCIGIFASQRIVFRVRAVNKTIGHIMQGQLHERLSPSPSGDAMAQLATSVNRMLDEIERLMEEVRGVGDDIAHDLRTPLTRMRARLERGLGNARSREDLAAVVRAGIEDLDQAFVMITALLRIGQIEGSARRAGFAPVSLTAIAQEAAELYQPMAELRDIRLEVAAAPDMTVLGDRDLLFELAANLLDNAVKFTPPGGMIELRTYDGGSGPVLSVRDTGPGIPAAERDTVVKRFHRGDRSRHVAGHGLGLSLVAAIVRLHLFQLHMADAAPGLRIEMRSWPAEA
jgi:signal transduction histidine kinase